MQPKRKSAYQTHKLSFESHEAMSLVHLYCNNRVLSPADLGSMLAALEAAYWNGQITWHTLPQVQAAFCPPDITIDPHSAACAYLLLAFEYTGRVIKSRYLLQEVIGFVDAGVIFRATDIAQSAAGGGEVNSILCTLNGITPYVNLLEDVANQIATTKISSCVFVERVFKDKGKTFLLLPALNGMPLCRWLAQQETEGRITSSHTIAWLRQFGRWLRQLESYPLLRKAVHPGQVWVDTTTYTLTALLLPLPDVLLTLDKRATYYQSALFENHPKTRAAVAYQLMAIGYELYTGSPPDIHHVTTFFRQTPQLPKRTFRALQRVLLENKTISWRGALGKLGISKVGLYFQRTVFASLAVVILLAGVDMGMQFWPDIKAYMAPEVGETTVVLTPQTKDQHINSLKAAFFNQVAERDIVGARASLQALQQLLPQDDIFIQKVAPQQLAESYLQAAKQVAETDRMAAGLLVRAAQRLAPDLPDLKTPEVIAMQLSAQELASLTAETPEETLLQSSMPPPAPKEETAPPTPVAAPPSANPPAAAAPAAKAEIFDGTHNGQVKIPPVAAKSAEHVGLKADPCLNAYQHKGQAVVVHCADALDQKQLGPRLIVLKGQEPVVSVFAIAQQPVTLADYQTYCQQTPGCVMPTAPKAAANKTGLKLDDVEAAIQKYNAYCIETGACAALSAPSYISLSAAEIKAYIEWLTATTGYIYRLPTEQEWAYMQRHLTRKEADTLRWGMVFPSRKEWVQLRSGELHEVATVIQTTDTDPPTGTVFRVVRELE